MARKLPYLNFFVGDWVKDTRMLSLATRAIWMDMLCLMHDSDRRGYLSRHGTPLTPEQVAAFAGCSAAEVSRATQELVDSGVCSCTEHGILYSRRMVRDERKRAKCSEAGKKGATLKGDLKGQAKGDRQGALGNGNGVVPSLEKTHSDGGHTEPETVCDVPRSNLPCDNVESYPAARKVVEHYQATVRPAHPRGGGIQAVIGLMNSGRLPGQLVKAAEGYAAECEQQGKSKQHRLSVTTFYGPGGSWEDYVNGKPRPELRTSLTPDERAERVLRQRQILDARASTSTNGNGVHT